MMRSAGSRSWGRGALQVGVLAGVGVLGVGGVAPVAANACIKPDVGCKIRTVRLMIALEYSTAMNQTFDGQTTRWQKAVDTIEALMDFDNGYLQDNFILGLMRFGSDPDPMLPDTTIFGDVTGLRDGVKLDVPWYDELEQFKSYFECGQAEPIIGVLGGLPPPLSGIGSWTKGALEFTAAYRAKADADHPNDMGKRATAVLLITAGIWTDPMGGQKLSPAEQNPATTAAALAKLGVPTFVMNVGGALGKWIANPLAQAGGTGSTLDIDDAEGLWKGLQAFRSELKEAVFLPVCRPSFPRVMFLLDASSAMLNVGPMHGGPGESAWDQVREALAGDASVLDALLMKGAPLHDIAEYALVSFGGEAPEQQTLITQYGLCAKPRIAWGLDPASSCEAPGCMDPYAAPPILWTSKNGATIDPPGFAEDVFSSMPRCDLDPQTPAACTGSGRFTHLGLQKVEDNLAAYKAGCLAPGSPDPCNAQTPWLNLLITDGPYDSTDAQVQARLESLFNAGVVTWVFGIGDAVDPAQLEAMAGWGSGGALPASFAADGPALVEVMGARLKDFVEQLTFDECCSFPECEGASEDPESTGEDTDSDSSGTTEATTGTGTSGSSTGGTSATSTGAAPTTSGTAETGTGSSSGGTTSTGADASTGTLVPTTSTSGTPPLDTTSVDSGGEQVDAPDGCACATGNSQGPGGLWLLALAGLFRRRVRIHRGYPRRRRHQ